MAKYKYTEIISCGCKVHKESHSNKVNIILDLKFYVIFFIKIPSLTVQ